MRRSTCDVLRYGSLKSCALRPSKFSCGVVELVQHPAVNRKVGGSSPSPTATRRSALREGSAPSAHRRAARPDAAFDRSPDPSLRAPLPRREAPPFYEGCRCQAPSEWIWEPCSLSVAGLLLSQAPWPERPSIRAGPRQVRAPQAVFAQSAGASHFLERPISVTGFLTQGGLAGISEQRVGSFKFRGTLKPI